MDTPTLAKTQLIIWYLMERYHVDPLLIFTKADIDPQLMYKEDRTYPYNKILDLWDEAAKAIPDPAFGLKAGSCWHPSFFGSLGHALLMCPSIRTTLETLIKYKSLIINQINAVLTDDSENQTLKFIFLTDDSRPSSMARENSQISCLQKILKFNSVKKFNFLEVNFKHKKPEDVSKYYAEFQCPINFESERTSALICSIAADFVLPVGSQSLTDFSEKEMTNLMLQQKVATFSYRISLILEQDLTEGAPTVDEMAQKLHLNTRSLQRALNKEDTNYQSILDSTRERLAEKYLAQEKEISEIAYLLGYSEQSAFSRSFKKLKGISPSEYREELSKNKEPI